MTMTKDLHSQTSEMQLATRLAGLSRDEIAALAELAIDALDAMDGDTDLEPDDDDLCEAADDGCAPVFRGGHVWWGSIEEGAQSSRHLPKPRYGIDQTHPIVGH